MSRIPHVRAVLAAASSALVLFVGCQGAVSPVQAAGAASAPAATTGQTPGTYVRYNFPTSAISNIQWKQTIDVSPALANVFWSNQFTFTNGFTGYTGFQTSRSGTGLFLVSIWKTTQSRAGSTGTYCDQFSEGGTGQSCRYHFSPVPGHTYVFDAASDATGWWTFTITDTTANTSFVLGSILVGPGVSLDNSRFVSWTEYFDWNDLQSTCADEAYSRLTMAMPTTLSSSGRVSASWTGTKISTSCAPTSKITLGVSQAVEENSIGNSAGGNITTPAGLCLQAGLSATVAACVSDTSTQNWVRATDGTLHANWHCLDAKSNGLTQDACSGQSSQVFQYLADQSLKNSSTGLCLTATAGAGSSVTLTACDPTSPAQRWNTPTGFGSSTP